MFLKSFPEDYNRVNPWIGCLSGLMAGWLNGWVDGWIYSSPLI